MSDSQITLTAHDIEAAIAEQILTPGDANRLFAWAQARAGATRQADVETAKGLNLVTVAYYFGAMMMIVACAWFLGDKWNTLGSAGVLATTLVYFLIAVSAGLFLRAKGYKVGGGLLVTVAVCLVPLITYSIEDLAGFWPAADPGAYKEYYPRIHGSWVIIEWATIIVSLIALRFVRFGFLTAPLGFSCWFFSMDIAALGFGDGFYEGNGRAWVSVVVGAITILIGYGLDRTLHRPDEPKSEDFAFWCYLFGLMAFSGGLTLMDSDSEVGKFIYMIIHLGMVGVSLWLRRGVFLVFGAIGVHAYLGHLAYTVFKDSFLFPFVLALLGLSLILVTIFAQRYVRSRTAASY
jgi:hypothetical protein